ncbi:MAG: hypothetical protein ACOYLE_02780 [Bacteroidales bacterium]
MKKITIILLMLFSMNCYCQDSTKTIKTKYIYCELVGTGRFMSTKLTINIDFGEDVNYWKDNRVKDETTGKVAIFNSMVDALNYMGEKGWEFVQAYTVSVGNNGGSVYHWLLKKEK